MRLFARSAIAGAGGMYGIAVLAGLAAAAIEASQDRDVQVAARHLSRWLKRKTR